MISPRVVALAAVLLAGLAGCAGPTPSLQTCPRCPPIRLTPAETRFAAPVVDLPLKLVRGLPILEVRINDQGPFRVVLDTGADAAALLTPRAVRQLELPDEGVTSGLTGITGEIAKAGVRLRCVHRLEIDGGQFHDFPALEAPALERLTLGIDGLLGMALFWDCLLTIDYPGRHVRITRGALPAPDGRELLPLARGTIQPVTNLVLGSIETRAMIDSGDTYGLSMTPGVAQHLAFSHGPVDGNLVQSSTGTFYRQRVGRLAVDTTLGHHVFARPLVHIFPDNRNWGAMIGASALAHFAVTFDRRRNVVLFVRDTHDPILSPPERTLGIVLRSGMVDDVIPGTPATALDIQRGDLLLTVEGRPIEELSAEEYSRMVAERDELVLVLRRGLRRIEVHVPVVGLFP